MHIIDRGPDYPSHYRYCLGHSFEIDGEVVVIVDIAEVYACHLGRIETESVDQILELNPKEEEVEP